MRFNFRVRNQRPRSNPGAIDHKSVVIANFLQTIQPMMAMDLAAGFAKTISEVIQIDRCIHEGDVEAKSAREATGNDRRREQSRAERAGPGGDFRRNLRAGRRATRSSKTPLSGLALERTQEVVGLERPFDYRVGGLGIIGKPDRCGGGGSRRLSQSPPKDGGARIPAPPRAPHR